MVRARFAKKVHHLYMISSIAISYSETNRTEDLFLSDVLNFLEQTSGDHRNRMITEIWAWSDDAWEEEHDFIQWLFPLSEKSMSVPNAPVIREPEVSWIRDSQAAQDSLIRSTERYKEFLIQEKYWKLANNHNHLRITRVIKSLRMLCGDDEANGFKYWVAGQLGDKIDRIDIKTKQYWRLA